MNINLKELLTNHGMAKNVGLALRTLGDDNIKHAEVKIGGEPKPEAKANGKIDLNLEVDIGGVTAHIKLDDLVISVW